MPMCRLLRRCRPSRRSRSRSCLRSSASFSGSSKIWTKPVASPGAGFVAGLGAFLLRCLDAPLLDPSQELLDRQPRARLPGDRGAQIRAVVVFVREDGPAGAGQPPGVFAPVAIAGHRREVDPQPLRLAPQRLERPLHEAPPPPGSPARPLAPRSRRRDSRAAPRGPRAPPGRAREVTPARGRVRVVRRSHPSGVGGGRALPRARRGHSSRAGGRRRASANRPSGAPAWEWPPSRAALPPQPWRAPGSKRRRAAARGGARLARRPARGSSAAAGARPCRVTGSMRSRSGSGLVRWACRMKAARQNLFARACKASNSSRSSGPIPARSAVAGQRFEDGFSTMRPG